MSRRHTISRLFIMQGMVTEVEPLWRYRSYPMLATS